MTNYKSYSIVNGKPRWIICDEEGNVINRNPTGEQLKIPILGDIPRKCYKCGNNSTYVDNSGRKVWSKYYGDSNKKEWDGKSWLCSNCYQKILNNLPNSYKNIIKSMIKSRNGGLDIFSETGKGLIGECIVANVLEIRSCDNCDVIKNYDFHNHYDIDHGTILVYGKYGKIDVKTSKLLENPAGHYKWTFHSYGKIDCDHYVCIGFDKDRNNVDSVHIIPGDKSIIVSDDICIYKYLDASRGSKWSEFMVDHKKYNDVYHFILSNLDKCPIFENGRR